MTSEERIRALEHRASDIEGEIRRLEEARRTQSVQVQELRFGRAADAQVLLIWLSALTVISFLEAVAILLLWWSR